MTTLGPWGVGLVYAALVLGVTGVSVFSLGVTFNYLVSLFQKRPIRQGMFKKPLFKKPLEGYFGWFGLAAILAGLSRDCQPDPGRGRLGNRPPVAVPAGQRHAPADRRSVRDLLDLDPRPG